MIGSSARTLRDWSALGIRLYYSDNNNDKHTNDMFYNNNNNKTATNTLWFY